MLGSTVKGECMSKGVKGDTSAAVRERSII